VSLLDDISIGVAVGALTADGAEVARLRLIEVSPTVGAMVALLIVPPVMVGAIVVIRVVSVIVGMMVLIGAEVAGDRVRMTGEDVLDSLVVGSSMDGVMVGNEVTSSETRGFAVADSGLAVGGSVGRTGERVVINTGMLVGIVVGISTGDCVTGAMLVTICGANVGTGVGNPKNGNTGVLAMVDGMDNAIHVGELVTGLGISEHNEQEGDVVGSSQTPGKHGPLHVSAQSTDEHASTIKFVAP
jgi:hypothetical protein